MCYEPFKAKAPKAAHYARFDVDVYFAPNGAKAAGHMVLLQEGVAFFFARADSAKLAERGVEAAARAAEAGGDPWAELEADLPRLKECPDYFFIDVEEIEGIRSSLSNVISFALEDGGSVGVGSGLFGLDKVDEIEAFLRRHGYPEA